MRPLCRFSYFSPKKGDVDYDATRNLLQWRIHQGTDNLCNLGTTGEASVLSAKERTQVLKLAVEVYKGKIPLTAGVGTVDPQKVKDMTLEAIDSGVDAGLLISPYYVKPPQRGLLKHFTSIADSGLPIVLYNVPGRTAVDISDETIALSCDVLCLVGIGLNLLCHLLFFSMTSLSKR